MREKERHEDHTINNVSVSTWKHDISVGPTRQSERECESTTGGVSKGTGDDSI